MKIKAVILLVILLVVFAVLMMIPRSNDKFVTSDIKSRNINFPTVIPSPTKVPIIFDQNSDLKVELEKATPEDFSEDFINLTEDVSKF